MNDIIRTYERLLSEIALSSDNGKLSALDEELCRLENEHANLLLQWKEYVCLLSGVAKDASICIGILGPSGHSLCHLIELLYPMSRVYWLMSAGDAEELPEKLDFLIIMEDFLSPENVSLPGLGEPTCPSDGSPCQNSERPKTILIEENGLDNCLSIKGKAAFLLKKEDKKESLAWDFAVRTGWITDSQDVISLGNTGQYRRLYFRRRERERVLETASAPKYKTIYALCPAYLKTGGTELVHQLVYWLNRLWEGCAYIVYIEKDGSSRPCCPPEFMDYVSGHVALEEEIKEEPENALVIPEGYAKYILRRKNLCRILWWLSVDNFVESTEGRETEILALIRPRIDVNLYQSHYAFAYLLEKGFDPSKMKYLSDYLNHQYLDHQAEALSSPKEDIVLYNPSKGYEFVKKLVKSSEDIQYCAINNLTTKEVYDLLCRAKIYIDFGNHPGKDRIPREAASCGCLVITGRYGSAQYYEDVPIPEGYKFDQDRAGFDTISAFIRLCLKEYAERRGDFDFYRQWINEEKGRFIKDVEAVFGIVS